ncbi:MAG: CsgG/HfaB family protein [Phycisphaerae bacterium]|jgi:curli biogenesis system outer membrane secretion channel CsgG|nr:CsgG/HfaB family protein [Phycisphaerae bacterium]
MKNTVLVMVLSMAFCGGCGILGWGSGDPAKFVKPSVAVIKFENRAPFPLEWDLGDGMKEMLTDALVTSERYRVIERLEIDTVLRELRFQYTGSTRKSGRAEQGRLKNVHYLIKGTITDFGHVSNSEGLLTHIDYFEIFTASQKAIMGMTLQVIEVESGEVVSSTRLEEAVNARDVTVNATYSKMAMGGGMFVRTPLGRATANVIRKAVKQITYAIADRKWNPKVAALQPDGTIALNGGKNRKIRTGVIYEVRDIGQAIVNPENEDILGYTRGKVVGWLEVTQVKELYSIARIVKGDRLAFKPGQLCRPGEVPTFEGRPVTNRTTGRVATTRR